MPGFEDPPPPATAILAASAAFAATFALGASGAVLAAVCRLPVPWLLGSLCACAAGACAGLPLLRPPPALLERWMRVVIGVSLGPGVARSVVGSGEALPFAILTAVSLTSVLAVAGTPWFERRAGLPRTSAFLAALPGGLAMLFALAGDAGTRREQVLLIHTVRVVLVVVSTALLARALGVPPQPSPIAASLSPGVDTAWPLLAVLVVAGFALAERVRIAGGHLLLPMLASALLAALTDLPVAAPPLLGTLAMLVFGTVLGFELASGSGALYRRLAAASVLYAATALALAAVLALALSAFAEPAFLVLFLAFVPGGIAEVSLVALALGLDAGLVALVHACRFLFIVFVGPLGLCLLSRAGR